MKHGRTALLGLVSVVAVGVAFWFAPIPQDPAYHALADQRAWFGVANFANVFSSLLLLAVGAFGLNYCSRLGHSRTAYTVFCLSLLLVGLGSAYYHLAPSTARLLWDRLPMSIALMALFSMVLSDRISQRGGRLALWPLVLSGLASVGYWYGSELQGRGDLRAYALTQFLPMLLVPLMLCLYRGRGFSTPGLWAMWASYALAKVAEHFDQAIYDGTGIISGHSIKHGLACVAGLWVIFAVAKRRRPDRDLVLSV